MPVELNFDAANPAGDIHSPGRKAAHWAQRETGPSGTGCAGTEEAVVGTVVVTNHAPSAGSVAPQYQGDTQTPGFVRHDEFFDVSSLWVHGYTHTAAEYCDGGCRVVSNSRGYRRRDGWLKNWSFAPSFVINLEEIG